MNSIKNIEVEVRGPLTEEEFVRVNSFLRENGTFEQTKDRILIDYSQGLSDRTRDIRIRETNGIPEIIVKLGSWGNLESREEISVLTEKNKFEDLVRIFGEMGFSKGVLCVRKSQVYNYKGVEFALVEVPGHSFYFEAEILSEPSQIEESKLVILDICKGLGLSIFSESEFFSYIKTLNKEANLDFDYADFVPGYFNEKKYLNKRV